MDLYCLSLSTDRGQLPETGGSRWSTMHAVSQPFRLVHRYLFFSFREILDTAGTVSSASATRRTRFRSEIIESSGEHVSGKDLDRVCQQLFSFHAASQLFVSQETHCDITIVV